MRGILNPIIILLAGPLAMGLTPNAPAEIEPSGTPLLPGIEIPEGVKRIKDIEYAEVNGQSLKLNLYLPKSEKPCPLVIYIHGGGWSKGSKDWCRAASLTAKGYAAASITYRFSQVAIFPAQLEDCKGAIRWLRAHAEEYGYDASRVGVWGDSAGGHLSALLATTNGMKEFEGTTGGNLDQSSDVQAAVDYVGPLDFFSPAATPEEYEKWKLLNTLAEQLIGGTLQEKPDLARQAMPITHMDKNDAPIFAAYGDIDNIVPISQSDILRSAAEKAGSDVTIEVVKGGTHFLSDPAVLEKVERFYDKHLKREAQSSTN